MPKYVYENPSTGARYEFEQRFNDPAYTHHPETGEPLKRLIFAPAVVFKGSGWYVKDSKPNPTSSSKPEAPADSSPAAPAPAAAD